MVKFDNFLFKRFHIMYRREKIFVMTNRTQVDTELKRPEDIQGMFGIKKVAYYARLKFLGMEANKDENGKPYLDESQVALLEELDKYIKKEGKMEGFSASSIVKAGDSSLESSQSEISLNGSSPGEEIHVNGSQVQGSSQQEQLAGLFRNAQQLRAETEVAKYILASQMTDEDLPPDLRNKVEAAKATVVPKSHAPNSWTQEMLANAQQYLNQQRQGATASNDREELG